MVWAKINSLFFVSNDTRKMESEIFHFMCKNCVNFLYLIAAAEDIIKTTAVSCYRNVVLYDLRVIGLYSFHGPFIIMMLNKSSYK